MSEADVSHSLPTDANLSIARSGAANLRGANLINADLRSADLTRADLSDAILREANLMLALLDGADVTSAELYETFFTAIDLSNVIGLDTCKHRAKLHRSLHLGMSGPLPLDFFAASACQTD